MAELPILHNKVQIYFIDKVKYVIKCLSLISSQKREEDKKIKFKITTHYNETKKVYLKHQKELYCIVHQHFEIKSRSRIRLSC